MSAEIKEYVDAAMGRRRLTLLIRDSRLVNVHTGEIYRASIGVHRDRIVYVGDGEEAPSSERVVDAEGAYAVPGLIDTHLHIESSMLTPSRFAESVLPHGTTTAVADPHEIANVLGKEGVRMMVEDAKGLPMKIYFLVPTCVPESPAVTSGAEIKPADVQEMLGWQGVVGLGEVMDFEAVLSMTPKMNKILDIGWSSGQLIDGHSPLLSGKRLSAYITAGPDSDHENFTAASTIEKLRAGMYAKLRPPFILNTKGFVSALKELPEPWNILFVTDDVMPDNLERFGHLDSVCRAFIQAGMDPVEAVRSCTIRPAQHLKRTELGAISPGKVADILLVRDLRKFRVDTVFSNGLLVASGGRMVIKGSKKQFDRRALDTVKIESLGPADFRVKPPVMNGRVAVNAIDHSAPTEAKKGPAESFMQMVLTKLSQVEIDVEDGRFILGEVALVLVFDRHHGTRRRSFGFVRNLIRRGAIASTVAHDAHNLIVAGTDEEDMYKAAKLVIEARGGIAAVDSKLLAFIDLPIAGLMSDESLGTVAGKMKKMRAAFRKMGVLDHPYMPIVALLTLSVIPHARITDKGIYDVDRQTFVEPYVRG